MREERKDEEENAMIRREYIQLVRGNLELKQTYIWEEDEKINKLKCEQWETRGENSLPSRAMLLRFFNNSWKNTLQAAFRLV